MGNMFGSTKNVGTQWNSQSGEYAGTSAQTMTPAALEAYQKLMGQISAQGTGLTPLQQQAISGIQGIQGQYQPTLNTAQGMIQGAGQPISSSAIQGYMNPYQQQVIDATMGQLNKQSAIEQAQLRGNAVSAGALGNNRRGVAESNLASRQNLNAAQTLAGLNASSYSQALGAAQSDAARQLAAGQGLSNVAGMGQSLGLQGYNALYQAGLAPWQNLQMATGMTTQVGGQMGGTTTGQQQGTYSSTGRTDSSSESSQYPGWMGILGMIAGAMADGGRVGYEGGGEIIPSGLYNLMVSGQQGQHAPAAPAPPHVDQNSMFKLGEKARGKIGKMFDKIPGMDKLQEKTGFNPMTGGMDPSQGTGVTSGSADSSSGMPAGGGGMGGFGAQGAGAGAPGGASGAGMGGFEASGSAAGTGVPEGISAGEAAAAAGQAGQGVGQGAAAAGEGAAAAGEGVAAAGEGATAAGEGIGEALSSLAMLFAKDGGRIGRADGGGESFDPAKDLLDPGDYTQSYRQAHPEEFPYDKPVTPPAGVGQLAAPTAPQVNAEGEPLPLAQRSPETFGAEAMRPAWDKGLERLGQWWERNAPRWNTGPGNAFAPSPTAGIAPAAPAASTAAGLTPLTAGQQPAGPDNMGATTVKPLYFSPTGEQIAKPIAPIGEGGGWKPAIETPAGGATTASDNGLAFIREQEGFSPTPYGDHNQTSIGYGTRALEGETEIDQAEADRRMRVEAGKVGGWLNDNITIPLNQGQYDALTSFGYNLGTGNLAELKADINAGNWERVRERMQTFNKSGGEVLPGLVARRDLEGRMLMGEASAGTPGEPAVRGKPQAGLGQLGQTQAQPGETPSGGLSGLIQRAPQFAQQVSPPDKGGLLKRLFGIDFNPLNLSDRERTTLMAAGLASAGGHPERAAAALEAGRQAEFEGQRLALEALKMGSSNLKPVQLPTYDAMGNPVHGFYDPVSGRTIIPQVPGVDLTGGGQTPEVITKMAHKYANYELPVPSGKALSDPRVMKALELAEQIRPGFSAQEYKTRQALKQSYTSGRDSEEIKSYNTVMDHVAAANDAVDQLGNWNSSIVNTLANPIREQFSGNFRKAKAQLASKMEIAIGEVNKATTGNKLTVDEAKHWREELNSAKSPDALHETLQSFMDMIHGRMEASANKWNSGMDLKEGDPNYLTAERLLSPRALQQYSHIRGVPNAATSGAPGAPGAQHAPTAIAKEAQRTGAQQRPAGLSDADLTRQAAELIRQGVDPKAVYSKLDQWGVPHVKP